MAGISNMKLPKIDTENLKNDEYTKKISNYLLSLEENLRYMFAHIDDENMTNKFIEDLTVQHLRVTNGDNSIVVEPKDGLQMLKGRKPIFGFDIRTGEAFFEGKITASSGNIGGWEISNDGLTSNGSAKINILNGPNRAMEIGFNGIDLYNHYTGSNEYLGGITAVHVPATNVNGLCYFQGLDAELISMGHKNSDGTLVPSFVYTKDGITAVPGLGTFKAGFTFTTKTYVNSTLEAWGIKCDSINGLSPGYATYADKAGGIAPSSSSGNAVYVSSFGNFRPTSDLGGSCGTELGRWTSIWSINGVIQTSDENQKNHIEDLDERYINFAKRIQPKKYKMNDGTSDRTHTGFIAQDIEKLLEECEISSQEFAGFIKTPIYKKPVLDEEGNKTDEFYETEEFDITSEFVRYEYALRYDEFIPLLFARLSHVEDILTRNNIV